jgi:peptidoglycan/xylan/chitin deacetylase (PgdA/CDA1 family)
MKRYLRQGRNILDVLLLLAAVALVAHPQPILRQFADFQRIHWHDHAVRSVSTRDKVVAITFDDGPDPRFTPQLLAILRQYHVHATFFMIGRQIERYPALATAVAADGNCIGNHTYSHPDLPLDSSAQVTTELRRCEELIAKTTGTDSHLFRPPRGMLSRPVISEVEQQGYHTILWTISADSHDAPTPALMADRVLRNTRPGTIILAHDGMLACRWQDVAATALIVPALQQQGYRFVTIPELLAHVTQRGK